MEKNNNVYMVSLVAIVAVVGMIIYFAAPTGVTGQATSYAQNYEDVCAKTHNKCLIKCDLAGNGAECLQGCTDSVTACQMLDTKQKSTAQYEMKQVNYLCLDNTISACASTDVKKLCKDKILTFEYCYHGCEEADGMVYCK